MEFRHLRAFVALAETLHFGRAAERLHLSQPPLSRQIRQLETLLGVKLFTRSTQRVALTEAGRAFLPEARTALAQVERAMRAARASGRGEEHRLEIGYLATIDHGPVAQIISAFRTEHPRTAIALSHMVSLEQIAALRDGRIDIGFVRLPLAHRGLACLTIDRHPFVAVLPATHRLARGKRIDLAELSDEEFITIAAHMHPTFHAVMLGVCRAAGFTPRIVHESEQLQNVVVMVASGLGIGLVPASVAAFKTPGVVFQALKGTPGEVTVESAVLWRPHDPSPIVAEFVACVRNYLASRTATPN